MNTEDLVAALFAKANPVPSLDLLDPIGAVQIDHLIGRSERSSEMTDVQTVERKEQRRPTRRPVFVAAVAIGIIALVAVALYLNRSSPVADEITPAEAVALAYLDALASNDVDELHELVAPQSDVDWNDQSLVHEWRRATGIVLTQLGCTERSTGPDGTLVDCPFIYGSDWHRALGLEPSSMQQTFRVEDGKIQEEHSDSRDDSDDVAYVWNTFRAWVASNHPEDVSVMYDDLNGGPDLMLVSIDLWEQYTDEFVTEMSD